MRAELFGIQEDYLDWIKKLWEYGESPAYLGLLVDFNQCKVYPGSHGWTPIAILEHYHGW